MAERNAVEILDLPSDNTFEKRRKAVRRQIQAAQKSLERESASGFGDRSRKAGDYLTSLNTQLEKIDRDEYEAQPSTQAKHLALSAAGVPVGMYAGSKYANAIQKKYDLSIKARNAELKSLAKQAEKILPRESPDPVLRGTKLVPLSPQRKMNALSKQKLGGIVIAADKLGLNKRPPLGMRSLSGPLALTSAGVLVAEAAFSRFVLGRDERLPDTAREIANSVGTGLATTGLTLVGKRALANQTTQAITHAASSAIIETARKAAGKEAVAVAASVASKAAGGAAVLSTAAKVAGPVAMLAVAGGVAAYNYRQHGSVKRALGAAADMTVGFGLTNFEGKIAAEEAKKRLSDMKTALSGGGRMQQLRAAYAKSAKKTDVTKSKVRKNAKRQRQSSLGDGIVQGHYATDSKTGKQYWVKQHMRSVA